MILKYAAISLFLLTGLSSLFFIGNDVRFTCMLLNDTYYGAFEGASELTPTQDLTAIFLFAAGALTLLTASVVTAIKGSFSKSLFFSVALLLLYVGQWFFFASTTMQKG